MGRDYDYDDDPRFRPSRAHKIRRERSWRTYSDFQQAPREEARYQDRYGGRRSRTNGLGYRDLSREYVFDDFYDDYDLVEEEYSGDYEPLHEHDISYEHPYESSYEDWQRSKYGGAVSVPGEYSGRGERGRDRYRTDHADRVAPHPSRQRRQIDGYDFADEEYIVDDYYAYAPEYYKERYMPEEDLLKKFYMMMFRKIEYDIKVPIMQIIATIALFFIFILNYHITIYQDGNVLYNVWETYLLALGKGTVNDFSIYVQYQPPAVAAFIAAIFGVFILIFPSLDRDLKRVIIIGTIILLIFFFAGPALWKGIETFDATEVGKMFYLSLREFLKIVVLLIYWAPIFIGIYGIWSRNSFYVGISAMFLFLTILILDIYLAYEGQIILKGKDDWLVYVVFSIILFCYIEMSDSAITFANLTSTENKKEIDPTYYEHLDRILKKYFVYFIFLTIFIIILTWLTLNFSSLLRAVDSAMLAESLEISSIYGTIISLIVLGIIILLIGLFIRNVESFKSVFGKITTFFSSRFSTPKHYYTPAPAPRRSRYYTERDRSY